MKSFESYRLSMTPLSPIHIGTGESYQPTNYVIDNETLYEFDSGNATAMSDADRTELLRITGRRPDLEMLTAVQLFFFKRRKQFMPYAIKATPVLAGVARLYESQMEANGGPVINQLGIDRTGFNPITRQPVLFGSSLKGAVRTALLDKVNASKPAYEQKGLHDFQGLLFKYQENRKLILEKDPLRLVQISDAAWDGDCGLPSAQVCLAVNRKKVVIRDAQGALRKSGGKDLTQMLECVPGWRYRAFSAQLNVQRMVEIARLERSAIPEPDMHFSMVQIAQACNAFYRPILENENRIMRERGYIDPEWDRAVSSLLATYDGQMRRGEVFLLRVGRHSGAESITLNGVRKIKIMRGRGEQPVYETSAKTLWLAAQDKDQQQGLHPFGWLFIEVHPAHSLTEERRELKEACTPFIARAQKFAAHLQRQRIELEKERIRVEQQRKEEAEKMRLAAVEEENRIEIERQRQAALAAMSVEERAIEDFRIIFEEQRKLGKYNPSGVFAERRVTFFKQALDWNDAASRHRAATLLRETIKWTDWPGKKERKEEFKVWLESLENRP